MPKRSAEPAEDSPKKVRLVSRSSKSPGELERPTTKGDGPEEAVEAAATSVSAGENTVDKSNVPRRRSKGSSVENLEAEFHVLKEKIFELFSKDVDSDDASEFNTESYNSVFSKLPEEDTSEKRALVDQFLRDFLLSKLLADKGKLNRFLELSISLARHEVCSASLPIALISDLVELSGLQDCETIFGYIESRLDVWKEPLFLNSGKNAVLRMCNDLLRRLSRAQNTIFCGRILIFLANYFPFSERSGLNIMSEFNAENVTAYKTGDGTDDPDDKMEIMQESDEKLFEGMDITIPGLDKIVSITQEEKKKKVKVDYNLYVKFWSLQDFFRNPMQCYNKIAWKTFSMYTQDVLGAFTSFKIENPHGLPKASRVGHGHGDSSFNAIPKLGDDDLYFPKYLTNRRLLELQMGDPSFRRNFMVQLLIILQYLTTSVKFKTESQTLGEDQLDFVKKTTERIYKLLAEIRPGGKDVVAAVQHILKREELWSQWKNDGCQPFKKPIAASTNLDSTAKSTDTKESAKDDAKEKPSDDKLAGASDESSRQPAKKKYLGDIIQEADENKRYLLGNPELTRLWNICGDNLEACRSKLRDFTPVPETYFADAMKELDPEPTPLAVAADPSKREIKPKKILGNPNFGWRALRLLARKSPYFFQMISGSPIHPLQNYLEFILKKIALDLETPVAAEDQVNKEQNPEKPPSEVVSSNEAVGPQTEGEQVVEGVADDNDELLKTDLKEETMEEEEEGEVDEKVRNLTEGEQTAIGKALGNEWKKVGLKLGFTKDEIEFFETEKRSNAGTWMLKMWTEQEKDDATVADLLYQLEGLKLRELVKSVFP